MPRTALLRAKSASELAEKLQEFGRKSGLKSVTPCADERYAATSGDDSSPEGGTDDLSDEQTAALNAVLSKEPQDVLVIAGPGSGKTKTLIASLVAAVKAGTPPEKIVAITFTNNAAAEMQVRLVKMAADLGLPALHRVHVSTFHSWVGQLAALEVTPWAHPPVRLGTAGLAVALHLTNPNTPTHVFTKPEVNAAERHLEGCESFDAMEERNFNRIGTKGKPGKSRQGFENLVKATNDLAPKLAANQIGSFGTLMASGVRLARQLAPGSISWLFIDEAQDLNAPQADFINAVQKQTGCRVFAIADDDQGIYKFRGASNRFLRDFGARKTTETLSLTENFRSTKPIVEVCRNWITPNWETLGSEPKKLHSKRDGLPVVLLTAWKAEQRGAHAKIIIEAALKAGLIHAYGEVASLGFSPGNPSFDVQNSGLSYRILDYLDLPPEVLSQWLTLCRDRKATGDWHHDLWSEFLTTCTAHQKTAGDPLLGHPGLNELYAALETLRRLRPEMASHKAAEVLEAINPASREKDFEKFFFQGDRVEPDYSGAEMNHLSLHSCKGMEFPVVWVSGCGYAVSVKDMDTEQGQPNLLGELGEWAAKAGAAIKAKVLGPSGKIDPVQGNKQAAQLENRRLLYVGMSRATDLLIISAPAPNDSSKKHDDEFHNHLEAILPAGSFKVITWDNQAEDFARTLKGSHRHPTWSIPTRYRVESFTSLTRQALPGEVREVEIPREREYPLPQSTEAMIGDLFHRIMHLLCLEPGTLQSRLEGRKTDAELIARVSTRSPATELKPLAALLSNYFSDTTNKPWEWLKNAKSEVPFTHLTENKKGETVLLKGFIDLVRFDPATGLPTIIVDYKTGAPPASGSLEEAMHAEQLRLYRDAVAASYSCAPDGIAIEVYHIASRQLQKFPQTR